MKRLLNFGRTAPGIVRHRVPALFMAAAMFAAVSCAGEREEPRTEGMPVGFRIDGGATRVAVTEASDLKKIGVFGYSHTGNYSASAAVSTPDYFFNQMVINPSSTGAGSWSYSGVTKYWPGTEVNLSLFAYAPYEDVDGRFELKPTLRTDAGSPSIRYTVPTDIYRQTDLLWSNSLDQTYASNGGVVNFIMGHALTKINFRLRINDGEKGRPFIVDIKELTVCYVAGTGTLDMSKAATDADLWDIEYPALIDEWPEYRLTPGSGMNTLEFDTREVESPPADGKLDPWTANDVIEPGQYLMLLPQNINGTIPAQVVVKYSYKNVYSGEIVDDEVSLNLAKGTLEKWEPGQAVTYNIILSLVEGTIIEFDIAGFVDGIPWVDKNSGTPIEGGVN